MPLPENAGRSRCRWRDQPMLIVMILLAMSLGAAQSAAAGHGSCPSYGCMAPAPDPIEESAEFIVAGIELSDGQRRSRIKMCCRRVEAGLPPKGFLCSYAQVRRAYREGICIPRR